MIGVIILTHKHDLKEKLDKSNTLGVELERPTNIHGIGPTSH